WAASLSAGRVDFFVTAIRQRRSISLLTASCNFRSSASSRYSSERVRSLGSLIRWRTSEAGTGVSPESARGGDRTITLHYGVAHRVLVGGKRSQTHVRQQT